MYMGTATVWLGKAAAAMDGANIAAMTTVSERARTRAGCPAAGIRKMQEGESSGLLRTVSRLTSDRQHRCEGEAMEEKRVAFA